ncbi:FUSC family protein [Horticoccus luteus]|uniref:FUSC family protein n=1 Tax=Horticoccus luteus TaxID=2862869 RepID=A0A8F9XGC4_9BACT|nr:FUSC family protein [Horticoccus luteus]QYM78070.1 FUSC family protein [Horticoccus luteus]
MNVIPARLRASFAQQALRPDLARAVRSTVAFMPPVLLMNAGLVSHLAVFSAIAAQSVAMVDVRGPYRLRVGLLLAMAAILAGATQLGVCGAASLLAAVLLTALVGVLMGAWRHLSSDYGPSLAASSALLFLIALATPAIPAGHAGAAIYTLGGALGGVALQAFLWPWRAQHPLRRAVAESWLALGNLFAALANDEPRTADARSANLAQLESDLRTALDQTYATLAAARIGRAHAFQTHLEELHLTGARLATRVVVLHTALDSLRADAALAPLAAAAQPALVSLSNLARSIATAVISRQPSQLASCEVRLQRLGNLLRVLQARLAAQAPASTDAGQVAELLRQLAAELPTLRARLRATIDRADERGAFSLELFDVNTWSLRPVTATLNLRPHVTRTLLRFTARLTVLLVAGVAAFKGFGLAHGYWLPLTIVVVLQPDYGSTRRRAAQRLLGTLTGVALASLIVSLPLPAGLLTAIIGLTMFGFAYYVRNHYGRAVFFVTIMVVCLLGAAGAAGGGYAVALERLLATAAGGALAMLAALLFWPVWENDRLPPILARALVANRDYWRILQQRLAQGGTYDAPVVAAKRAAEVANSNVFASLQRLFGDPKNHQARVELFAALANGNQRLTRAFTGLALHLSTDTPLASPPLAHFGDLTARALDGISTRLASGASPERDEACRTLLADLEKATIPTGEDERHRWISAQLARVNTETTALLLAASQLA